MTELDSLTHLRKAFMYTVKSAAPPSPAQIEEARVWLAEARKVPDPMQPAEQEALERLLEIAQRDTGQSCRVANFLLSWWNADDCGQFDPRDVWALDRSISDDVVTVFGLIARVNRYPDGHDRAYRIPFDNIVRQWRPELFARRSA